MNTGAYGTCNANCTLPPRCGDAHGQRRRAVRRRRQPDALRRHHARPARPAACSPATAATARSTAPTARPATRAADNGKGYGCCTASCKLGPRCGDGVTTRRRGVRRRRQQRHAGQRLHRHVQAQVRQRRRRPRRGVRQRQRRQHRRLRQVQRRRARCGPRCGDGIKNGPEACDDGKNDGSYGTCAPMCKLGPRCGDIGRAERPPARSATRAPMNAASAYGPDKCDGRCRPAPFCGDKEVDAGTSARSCDDGVNSGQPGSCKTDCSDYVPLPSCGDGIVADATSSATTGAANGTDGQHLRHPLPLQVRQRRPRSGRGLRRRRQQRRLRHLQVRLHAGRLLRRRRDERPRAMRPAAPATRRTPTAPSKCTTMCTTAPYCGDGRIQSAFGETCDGTPAVRRHLHEGDHRLRLLTPRAGASEVWSPPGCTPRDRVCRAAYATPWRAGQAREVTP